MRSIALPRFFTGLTLILMLVLALALSVTRSQPLSAAPDRAEAGASNLNSGTTGLSFTFNVPQVTTSLNGIVSAPGLDSALNEPGQPALPFFSTLIALPPEASVSAEISESSLLVEQVATVRPGMDVADRSGIGQDLSISSLEELGIVYEEDAAIYGSDEFFPNRLFELSEPMYLRDLRVVRLTLYPIRYNPAANELITAQQIDVNLTFEGADFSNIRPAPSTDANAYSPEGILNAAQADGWRSLPANSTAAPTTFPIGIDTFKIPVTETGIHKVTFADLQAAGLNTSSFDAATVEMMHNGQSVAYRYVNNGGSGFDSADYFLFYGWEYDGSRHERQFIGENIYWLWSGGTPSTIPSEANETGNSDVFDFPETAVIEQDNTFITTSTSQWVSFEFEGDTWYWDKVVRGTAATFSIDLNHPTTSGMASFDVEIFSDFDLNNHEVELDFAGGTSSRTWNNIFGATVEGTVAQSNLQHGANDLEVNLITTSESGDPISDQAYFNNITVQYERELTAINDALNFNYAAGGSHTFNVGGFAENQATDMIAWNVTDPYSPKQINVNNAAQSGSGPYTYKIGDTHSADSKFTVSSIDTVLTPSSALTKYVAPDIEPSGNGADWVAVTHANFESQTNRLATHRANHSGMTTHVVDIEDVVNQYGYGFNSPAAIQNYTAHALADWSTAPTYLILVGDATQNPRYRECALCNTWNSFEVTYVVTDLVLKDRFLGIIPTDHTFATIVGSDDIPDISVGRFAVNTSAQMKNMVDKIMNYDGAVNNFVDDKWTNELLFISDNEDAGGRFCTENAYVTSNFVPEEFDVSSFCLDDFIEEAGGNQNVAKENLKTEMFSHILNGVGILNYRGHGAIGDWAGGLIEAENAEVDWFNIDFPTVILSADCLDGHFAWLGEDGLSEVFLELDSLRGTAGHWSSTGLGYSFEHTVLHVGFYEGAYQQDLSTYGNAINFAKTEYLMNNSGDISEIFSFTYQGDPAMEVPLTEEPASDSWSIFLPILEK